MTGRELDTGGEKRRRVLLTAMSSAGLALASCARSGPARGPGGESAGAGKQDEEAEVTPGEDLMQEHGALERILLIYEEAARRIDRSESLDLAVIANAAGIIQRFIEQYHEQSEEKYVFPRLEA